MSENGYRMAQKRRGVSVSIWYFVVLYSRNPSFEYKNEQI